jgi:hypothetical protein
VAANQRRNSIHRQRQLGCGQHRIAATLRGVNHALCEEPGELEGHGFARELDTPQRGATHAACDDV